MYISSDIGVRIKQLRLQMHLSQTQIAGNDMTRSLISQIENGKCSPSFSTLSLIAQRLGKPIEYFFSSISHEANALHLIDDATTALQNGNFKEAIEKATNAVQLSQLGTDDSIEPQAHYILGVSLRKNGEWQRAFDELEEALELFLAAKDKKRIIETQYELGNCSFYLEEYKNALRFYRKVIRLCNELKTLDRLRVRALLYLGTVYYRLGENENALSSYKAAEQSAKMHNDPDFIIDVQMSIGWVLHILNDTESAIAVTTQALHSSEISNKFLRTELIQNLGIMESARGNWESALLFWNQCLNEFRQNKRIVREASLLADIATYWVHKRDFDHAELLYNQSLSLLDSQNYTLLRGTTYRNLGMLYKQKGEKKSADECFRISVNLFRNLGSVRELATTIEMWQGEEP